MIASVAAPASATTAVAPAVPLSPDEAWRALVADLADIPKASIVGLVAKVTFEDGTLALTVRNEMAKSLVGNALRPVEIGGYFPGFRRQDVRVDSGGRTGTERRTAEDDARAQAARAAAEASPLLKKILAAVDGTLLSVEPVTEAPRDMELAPLESDDE